MQKAKTMDFQGNYNVRTEIMLDGIPIEQVTRFKYLGYAVTIMQGTVEQYLVVFQQIYGTINRVLKYRTQKDCKFNFTKWQQFLVCFVFI